MDCSIRRSMSQALQTGKLSDDALAFVSGKTARPGAEVPLDTTPTPPPQNDVPKSKPADSFPSVAGIASITVRLPAKLPSRLLRASVERKLLREQPFTQQDIVAEALDAWLRLHGYPD